MQRIAAVVTETATGPAKEILDVAKRKMGRVPNMMRTMVQSPPVLEGYLTLGDVLAKGVLTNQQREQIAVYVAQLNGCEYCLSAHTFLGGLAKLSPEELEANRRGESADPKSAAILRLAGAVVAKRGNLSDEEVAQAREAGLSDAEMAEVVANVAKNIYSNYFNNLARTALDWKRVAL